MLDRIPLCLRIKNALSLSQLANAVVAILELRDGNAGGVDCGWSREEVVKRVAPWLRVGRTRWCVGGVLVGRSVAEERLGHVEESAERPSG